MKKILVANRGEIAIRVMRTAKKMGIKTVAVFSEVDRNALHVKYADEAVCIGPAPSNQSYLRGDKIIEVAKSLNVDGIHPGYGFLSENAEFAELCEKNDMLFIGPKSHAIKVMGSKLAAKETVKSYNIPMVPGTEEAITDIPEAKKIANEIGFPILIKASAGGGGKGMRIVENAAEFESQMDRAISEAGMNRLSEAVVANLKPEKIASAMAYALDMGYAEEPTSDKLIEAIYANTEEDFETALTPLLTAATGSGASSPDIDRFRVNPMSLTSMDSDKTAKVQKQIERSLMSQLGGSYNADTGNIVWQNPDAAGEIIQNAVEYFKVQISDPLIQKDESDVYSEIFDKINFLTGNMSLRDIATNYPTFDYNPQTIERPEPPDPNTSATEDLIEEEGED